MQFRSAAERFLGAYVRKDWESLRKLLDPQVVWRFPGQSPIGGDAVGPDAVIARARAISADQSSVALGGIFEGADGFGIALDHSLHREGDNVLELDVLLTARMKDGLVSEIRSFLSDLGRVSRFYGGSPR